jgi:hypothetical protein
MKSEETTRRVSARAFVALMIGLSGLGLPVTGVAIHIYEESRLSVEHHAWMSAHNLLGALCTVFSIWHVVLNRRALLTHVKSVAGRLPAVSREAILAVTVVALALMLLVGHAFLGGAAR